MRFKTSVLVFAIGVPVAVGAQSTADTLSLTGRSNLMIGVGLIGERGATASPGHASASMKGEAASFAFNHWVRPEVAVNISASLLRASASAGFSNGGASANAIFPVLFGLSYSPRTLALSTSIRPYVSAAAGPYFHTVSGVNAAVASNYNETVMGGRFGAGANWFAARHFTMAIEANYHAVGRFERQDAVTKDPSGFGMNLGFGFAWGAR